MVYVIKKLNVILIFSLLIFISLGAASAAEDTNDTLGIDEVEIADIDFGGEILSASSYTVTPANYGQFFSSSGQLAGTVNDGDTLTFSGEFSSKNFVLNKNITIVGSEATIKNGVITLKKAASGSDISGLKIVNTGDNLKGFFLDGASYCNIHGNVINNTGVSSYPICLNTNSNFNILNILFRKFTINCLN